MGVGDPGSQLGLCRKSPKTKRMLVEATSMVQSAPSALASPTFYPPAGKQAAKSSPLRRPPGGQTGSHPAASMIESKCGRTCTNLEEESDEETGWCLAGRLPHQCGDQRTRFSEATAPDEPPEAPEPRCQWEDWAATLNQRHEKPIRPQLLMLQANNEEEPFLTLTNAAAWGSSPNMPVFEACIPDGPASFGQHPYLQPLNLSDAASEGESKSRVCLAGLSKGLYVCL